MNDCVYEYSEIDLLLKKYIGGDTTREEESKLKEYFCNCNDIPSDWLPYKALFAFINIEQE